MGSPDSPPGRPAPSPKTAPSAATPVADSLLGSCAHSAVLLSALYSAVPQLIADPAALLTHTLLPLAAVQVAYTALCLPPTSSSRDPLNRVSEKRVANTDASHPALSRAGAAPEPKRTLAGSVSTSILALLVTALLGPVLVSASLVLFGARADAGLRETFLCAAHIALLAIHPLVHCHGVAADSWSEIVALTVPVDAVVGGVMGCFVGAWAGAVPIPLDWDRPWQRWPITIVVGAYVGLVVGKLLGGTVFRGKRVM